MRNGGLMMSRRGPLKAKNEILGPRRRSWESRQADDGSVRAERLALCLMAKEEVPCAMAGQ